MRKFIGLVAVVLLASAGQTISADASDTTCFGKTPTYIGTSGDDVVYAAYENNVILTKGGNDIVNVTDEDSDGVVYVCTGDGNDKIYGNPYKVHAGSGSDKAEIWACSSAAMFDGVQLVQKVEYVTLVPCRMSPK